MLRFSFHLAKTWIGFAAETLVSGVGLVVFSLLDLLDSFLCKIYRVVDELLEENSPPCYCECREEQGLNGGRETHNGASETLYERNSLFRHMGLSRPRTMRGEFGKLGVLTAQRWSDCGCDSCNSWRENGGKLHLEIKEPSRDNNEDHCNRSVENVIFLHGFLSSSSFWTETVFPNLSAMACSNYRLLAVDLLGFGRSPKPQDCLYGLEDHLESIEKSVIGPFQLDSFHLVAHSMGCIIALALAAKYPNSVRSITLIAPPYFPSAKDRASHIALDRLAGKRLWPLLMFGSSVMSWYEHVGRTVCFLFCRNHRMWERLFKLITWRRDLHFMMVDMSRHTHHSAWHTMHNVICGGAKFMDDFLEAVNRSGATMTVIQGGRDKVVPLECSYNVILKVPNAKLEIIPSADHSSVVLGRARELTNKLELTWSSSGIHLM